MKISYNWLKDYINIDLAPVKLSEILTDCGLEVESMEKSESVKGGLKGLFIGHVKSCEKHPNADKLSVTKVDIGQSELLTIVCGAPNVEENQKVIVAPVGSILFTNKGKDFPIKKVKIRGQESAGMICAEDEIGIGNSHDGIIVLPEDAKTGTPASEYYNIKEDVVFEIGLTPNRVDASSHIGTARDIAAVLNANLDEKALKNNLTKPDVSGFKGDDNSRFIDVIIEDKEACPRYSGLTISGVKVEESPDWLKFRLKAIGLKPINNIVDITNFVLHEMGQPLHAFDADKVKGNKIVVRKPAKGTKFITLDEEEIELTGDNLMICNAEEPMCIAGVLGGVESGVNENTTNIFLESAYFHPSSIRKTSKHHDIKTDASFRFERGTDPNITVFALKRSAMLIKEIAGGKISSDIVDNYPNPVANKIISVKYDSIDNLIGKKIERNTIKNILTSLEIEILSENEKEIKLEIPAFKVDVYREADITEEVLRVYGYNNVEIPEKLVSSTVLTPRPDKELLQNTISDMLCATGFVEIMNNSLTKAEYYKTSKEEESAVKILNPLSQDLSVMRQNLIYGGLEVIAYNQNRKIHDVMLFEFGNIYSVGKTNSDNPLKKYNERKQLALFMCGQKESENWNSKKAVFDFFDVKANVVAVLQKLGINSSSLITENINDDVFEKGLGFVLNEKTIAKAGLLKQAYLKKFDLKENVWYAEIEWGLAVKNYGRKQLLYKEVPKFPEVRRDLALLMDKNISFSQIEQTAFKTERRLLKKVGLFDVYQDAEKIGKDKKSYAVSFILQDEKKTLTDKEIDKVMAALTKSFEKEFGATIR